MSDDMAIEELRARVRRLEDESAIKQLLLSYGPTVDAGLAERGGGLWFEDGIYDWDAQGEPHRGSAEGEAMLRGDRHQGIIRAGVAHFAGPLLIELDGDRTTVLNYSLIMRRDESRFYLWRVSAVRWDVERDGERWRVRQRTNRLLDETGVGRELFEATVPGMFQGGPR